MGKVTLAVVAAGSALLVMGCVVEPPPAAPPGVAVSGPPPAPMLERRTAAPSPETTWIAGYWHWTGMQYTWIPGHWEHSPPGARWRAPRYSTRDGSYFYEPGAWSRP